MTMIKTATSRADVRFNGTALQLVAATGVVPPAASNGIAITTTGNVGIGTIAPLDKLTVQTVTGTYGFTHTDGTISVSSYVGGSSSGALGGWLGTKSNHALYFFVNGGQPAMTILTNGVVGISQLAGGGDENLCRNSGTRTIATCGSSLRYKEQIAPYTSGLELINRLRPITFAWKNSGRRDLGLAAEEVAQVEPLLVTHNDKGEIEGVKYDHLNVVLINAIKQQASQIETLRAENDALNVRLRSVERIIHKRAGVSRRRH